MRHVRFVLLTGALALASCSSGEVVVSDAWARPLPPGTDVTAMYVSLEGTDGLAGGESDACGMVEIHTTEMTDGVMQMRPLELPVSFDGELVMEPGGVHVMCMQPTAAFEVGDTVTLTLTLEEAGALVVDVPVEDR